MNSGWRVSPGCHLVTAQPLLAGPCPVAASLLPRPWSFNSLVISQHWTGTLCLLPGVCSQALTTGISLTCCRDLHPPGSFPTIAPSSKPGPLCLFSEHICSPFAVRPHGLQVLLVGGTWATLGVLGRSPYLWPESAGSGPSMLSFPTPHQPEPSCQ